jgi:RNA polymerase-binding transcription factor DksA
MPLTTTQSSELQSRLDLLSREIQTHIRHARPQLSEQSFADLAGTVYDAGDESVATMIEELSHAQLERYVRELRQIERARQRLADGEINECVECGEDIGYKRLHVHPVATRCIHCQTQHERTYGSHAVGQA